MGVHCRIEVCLWGWGEVTVGEMITIPRHTYHGIPLYIRGKTHTHSRKQPSIIRVIRGNHGKWIDLG